MEIRVETLASWNTNYGKKNSMTMNLKGAKWKMKNRQCWTQTSKSGYTPDKKKQKGVNAKRLAGNGGWLSLTLTRWNMNLSASWNPCYQYIQRICTCVYIYISLYNYMTSTLVP
jgi:hypothetical protein